MEPFRFRGRFVKEPRRGVDPDEQRQIADFIARNGVKKLPAGWSQYGWQSYAHPAFFASGRVGPRAQAQ